MANYNKSTRQRVADLITGMHVQSDAVLANATYLAQTQVEDFNVYGRILLMQLYMEVETTDFDANATLFQYTYSNATHTPAIVSTKLGLVSLSIASATIGCRVCYVGGAVAGTNHVITNTTGGVSDLIVVTPAIIGYENATGTLGHLTTVASQAAGGHRHHIFYVPMSEGAYVTAVR